ncbi:MAG TPA: peptidylprolyl isomerase [Anaeromyxobacteraceae bacterium]|nr:peptidylprolyl isomerase [Anaeromyxobacteraceae bacterium]
MVRILAFALVLAAPGLALCQQAHDDAGGEPEEKPATKPVPKAKKGDASKAGAPKELFATFVTSAGKIGVQLFPEQKPKAVKNFVDLATGKKEWTDPRTGQRSRKPIYDGTVFHRVIPHFMIQGGDPLGIGVGGPGYAIPDELEGNEHFFDKPCQLAYANSGPNTNGSQFFITEVPTLHLNPVTCSNSPSGLCGYVRFGEGVCGCDLVAKIAAAGNNKTTLETVVISKVKPTCQ